MKHKRFQQKVFVSCKTDTETDNNKEEGSKDLLTPDEDFLLNESACVSLFLVFCHIGEYLSDRH